MASKLQYPGRRFAQIVKLKPEFLDKYKEVHAAVWPEVLKQIADCNIVDCTCLTLSSCGPSLDSYYVDADPPSRQHLP
jgi:hypothetical protein